MSMTQSCQKGHIHHSWPFIVIYNKWPGDKRKAAARRSYAELCPLPKFYAKLLSHAKFHWHLATGCWVMAKNDFQEAVRHLFFEIWSLCHVTSIVMLFCFLCKISLKFDDQLLSYVMYKKKQFLKWRPCLIVNFKNFYVWSSGCHRVTNLLSCTIYHQNRMTFHLDMAI